MANDKWQFAKVDVNLLMNPKWFQVERSIRNQLQEGDETRLPIPMGDPIGNPMGGLMGRVRYALLEAQQLHLASILYSVQFLTDGVFPVDAIKGIVRCENEEAVTALFEVGMWINLPGGMAEIHDFLKHQTSSQAVKKAAEDGRKGAQKRWEKSDTNPNGVANGNPIGNKNKNKNKNNTPYKSPKGDRNKPREYSPEFTEFWNVFPNERKADKPKCADKFDAAIKAGVEAQTIITAAQRYAADPTGKLSSR